MISERHRYDARLDRCREVIAYGIASTLSEDIRDFYVSRDEADAALAQIHGDEPELEGQVRVEAVEFEVSLN